jgi:hypothetical protein
VNSKCTLLSEISFLNPYLYSFVSERNKKNKEVKNVFPFDKGENRQFSNAEVDYDNKKCVNKRFEGNLVQK